MAKRYIAFLLLAFQFLNPSTAQAKELVFDGITPQSDVTLTNRIAINNDYGFGFIAGETRDLVEVNIVVDGLISSGTVSAYVYQNSSNGNAGTGTFIGTLTQSEISSSYGALSNAYLLRMKGRASLVAGLKYWIFFRYANYSGSGADYWGSVTPNVVGSWSIVGSAGSYQLVMATNNFSHSGYPIARLYLSTPTTIAVSLNSGGNSATYRRSATLRASVNSDGPVTFYANGKKIGGCISIQSTSGVALCPWKPSFRGAVQVKARVVPRDSENYDPAISTATTINVDNRTNRR